MARRRLLVAVAAVALVVVALAASPADARTGRHARPKPSPSASPSPSPTPSPTPTQLPPSGWPDASTTGPTGTLAVYTGPCAITVANTVIENVRFDGGPCAGGIDVNVPGVVMRNVSLPNGDIQVGYANNGTLLLEDAYVNGGSGSVGAVHGEDFTIRRSEITGGQHNVHCWAGGNCHIYDSWLHDAYPGAGFHMNAFLSNGGTPVTLDHNRLSCQQTGTGGGGCSRGGFSLYGDEKTPDGARIVGNLFERADTSAAYCVDGGNHPAKPYPLAYNVTIEGNVFERGGNGLCGMYGPADGVSSGVRGNTWSGNTWDDGTPLTL